MEINWAFKGLTFIPLMWRIWRAYNNASKWQMGFDSAFKGLTLIPLMWRIWWALNNASKWQMGFDSAFKGLRTVRPIYRTGVPLPFICCIIYICIYIIFSTNISTEYFKNAAHSSFFSSKCRLFRNSTFFGSCIIHTLHTGWAKI
jgi:hypothetical protein